LLGPSVAIAKLRLQSLDLIAQLSLDHPKIFNNGIDSLVDNPLDQPKIRIAKIVRQWILSIQNDSRFRIREVMKRCRSKYQNHQTQSKVLHWISPQSIWVLLARQNLRSKIFCDVVAIGI
jgi:hypothetical protein